MHRLPLALAVLTAVAVPAAADDREPDALGGSLFQDLCAACHGEDAKGVKGAGSDIRDSIVRQVRMATGGGYEDMPEIELSEEEMRAIVTYLNSL